MEASTFAVGSLDALRSLLREGRLKDREHVDVVIVPTAAAFSGIADAASRVRATFDDLGARIEVLPVSDRAATSDQKNVDRLSIASLVVLCDGSSLHARSVWRDNAFGEAINAASLLVAVGSVASVLGEVMIDPRGGAPMVGLGYRKGAALCQRSSDEQMYRTRSLLGDELLMTIGATGVVGHDGERWKVLGGDVVVTRGHDEIQL